MQGNLKNWLLAGVALVSLTPQAFAAAAKNDAAAPASQAKLDALQQQIQDLSAQVQVLKQTQADSDPAPALSDLKRSASDQYVDLSNQIAAQPKIGIDNGRLTVASADGRFSLALRGLIQYDLGYFAQGKNPAAIDLSSGSNFRRAQFGLVGTAWRDWSYNLTLDFGGNGTEKSGYLYTAYVQYDGLKPGGFRIGAYAPPAGLEDATGSADLLFLERPASADIARNIAGSPSRDAATVFVQGDTYLASLSYTGGKVGDAATFDEQQAIVGRAAALVVNTPDVKWLLDGDFTHVFKLADTAAGANSPTAISFSNGPELAVDAIKTVNTGNFDAASVTQWGLETAAEYRNFYGQGGYFHYGISRRTGSLPNPDFSGWYALAAWTLTGEARRYDPVSASFRGIRPAAALGSGGFGAWELKARFSNINLDYQPLLGPLAGGVAGGEQNVWTLGINWYPTDGIRLALDYDNMQVNHPNAPAIDISSDAVALRAQLSL